MEGVYWDSVRQEWKTSEWRDGNWIDVDEDSKGLEILDSEVTNAIEALKVGKAMGPDGIPAEFWKVLGAKGTKELVELCKEMYLKGMWPSDFTIVMIKETQKHKKHKKHNETFNPGFHWISMIEQKMNEMKAIWWGGI